MKVAQIAPLAEAIPPRLYGGSERVVSWLTEELVRMGHEVTLFASGDSRTAAELVPVVPESLRLASGVRDYQPYHYLLVDTVYRRCAEFDVLHFHVDMIHYPLFRSMADRVVTTMHGRLDLPDIHPFYRAFPKLALVSISQAQRAPMPPVNWVANIPHGLPSDLLSLGRGGGGYLAFLGRICPEKGPEKAIEIAKRAGMKLKIAAKVDVVDRDYFVKKVEPLLDHPLIDFVGEVGDKQKCAFLGNADAVLFPIDWPEPFGLIMAEAAACGTPVIAFNCGSVPEVIEDGVTGFIVANVDEAVAALKRVAELDRALIRERFEQRFTVSRMTNDYVDVYKRLVAGRAGSNRAA